MVPIDEAGNSEKWTCTVRGNTHNTFSSLFVMFLLWCFLCLLHRCLCLFISFLSFTSFLPSSFVLLFLMFITLHVSVFKSFFKCIFRNKNQMIVGFVSSFLFCVSLLLYLHRLCICSLCSLYSTIRCSDRFSFFKCYFGNKNQFQPFTFLIHSPTFF